METIEGKASAYAGYYIPHSRDMATRFASYRKEERN